MGRTQAHRHRCRRRHGPPGARRGRPDDASIKTAIAPYVQGDCLVAFDAPLVVTNPTGQRPSEAALNRDFAKFEAGAHPTNTGKAEFAGTPRAARLAEALDLDIDPQSQSPRRAIEVYPHPATVALFRLGRTLKYKAKPGRSVAQLRSELLRLMDLIEGLAQATPPLRVTDYDDWPNYARRRDGRTQKRVSPRRGPGRRRHLRLRGAVRDPADPTM